MTSSDFKTTPMRVPETPITCATGLLSLLALALSLIATGCGSGEGAADSAAEAPVGTLAYVVTECRVKPDEVLVLQELRIRRTEQSPVTVKRVTIGPLPPDTLVDFPFSSIPPQEVGIAIACKWLGDIRLGSNSVFFLFLQDVAVSPDGSGIVFEVTDNFSPLDHLLAPEEEGIFFVHSDGTGLRQLGVARTAPSQVLKAAINLRAFAFSPNGEKVVFIDDGPSPTGEAAPQVVTVDIADGTRRTLTRLPPAPPSQRFPSTCCAYFPDDGTIAFSTTADPDGLNPGGGFAAFTVDANGAGLTTAGPPIALPGAMVEPRFSITGEQPGVTVLEMPRQGDEAVTVEVFFVDGERLLQLTNFGRRDTISALLGGDGRHVFFAASDNPAGENPTENCQIFSVPTIGGEPHQLTHFRDGDIRSFFGCLFSPFRGCAIGGLFQDPENETLVFHSSCDPLGGNATGEEVFAMRPDGTGLRQLTETRGVAVEEDGTLVVEIPGPYGYPVGSGQRPGG